MSTVLEAIDLPFCACGCGERVKTPNARFLRDHNRVKGRLATCARPGCDETFWVKPYQEAKEHEGKYHSKRCYDLTRRAALADQPPAAADEGDTRIAFVAYVAGAIEAKRLQDGLTTGEVAAQLGMTYQGLWRLQTGKNNGIRGRTVGRIADWLDRDLEELIAAYADKKLSHTIIKAEAKRIRDGLTFPQAAGAIGIGLSTYKQLCDGSSTMTLRTCGLFAKWLGVTPEEVLRWEGRWDKLSTIGRVLAPAMLTKGMSISELAAASGTAEDSISLALWNERAPVRDSAYCWADALEVDPWRLRLPAKNLRRERSATYLARLRPKARRTIFRKYGSDKEEDKPRDDGIKLALAIGHERWRKKRTPDQCRAIMRQRRTSGIRAYWATMTPEEKERRRIFTIKSTLTGILDVCRFCLRLTYTSPAEHRRGRSTKHHVKCHGAWRKGGPEYTAWREARRLARRLGLPAPAKPEPPAYPPNRRARPSELMGFWRAGVRYQQLKVKSRSNKPKVNKLIEELNIPDSTLYYRAGRLMDLLPDPAVCSPTWGRVVATIKASDRGHKRSG